jgi:hypothetical protein
MKTIKNDYTRKKFFDMILDNHHNNYDEVVKHQLKTLSKFDLIRFVNYLHLYIGNLYVDINGNNELNLFSC